MSKFNCDGVKTNFEVGDKVSYLPYCGTERVTGVVVKNVSTQYAEIYKVKFRYLTTECSAALLSLIKRGDESKMEKAKITKEQYDAIQSLEYNTLKRTGKAAIVECHVRNPTSWSGDQAGLKRMSLDKLIRALYIGYEVELTKEEQIENILVAHYGSVRSELLVKIKAVYEGDN